MLLTEWNNRSWWNSFAVTKKAFACNHQSNYLGILDLDQQIKLSWFYISLCFWISIHWKQKIDNGRERGKDGKHYSGWSVIFPVQALLKFAKMCNSSQMIQIWDWFGIAGLFRVSGFQWHCSKWACQFTFRILQYQSWLKLLACIIDTDLNRQH